MTKYLAEKMCSQINYYLSNISFRYEEIGSIQEVAISEYPAVQFLESAGGGVVGGSAQWVRQKHKDGGIHEPGMIAALLAILDVNPSINTILDIGALYGYFSLISRSLFHCAEVHAFEVNPKSFKALRNNIATNEANFGQTIFAHHCALSDCSSKQTRLKVHGFAVETVGSGVESNDQRSLFNIDMWSLDDFCRARELRPDLIKIDVEGYQAKIIPGAMGVISNARPIVLLEFDGPNSVNNFGISNKEVIAPMIKDGYQLIWGKHRNWNSEFDLFKWKDLSDRHEINSLGILIP